MGSKALTRIFVGVMAVSFMIALYPFTSSAAQTGGPKFDFEACDTDKDGALSKAEFMACHHSVGADVAEGSFTKMDFDGDGILTKAELKQYTETKRQAGREEQKDKPSKKHKKEKPKKFDKSQNKTKE